MNRVLGLGLGVVMFLAPTTARSADPWGLRNEQKARFEAKVVDVLCELTGDCPASCSGSTRQLGLLTDEGKLILPLKNYVPFAGAAVELIEFCGKRVVADGLFMSNRGLTVFALQYVRAAPDGEWRRASRFLRQWAKDHGVAPDSSVAKQWFRNDPRVKALIEEQGKLGLGPTADVKHLKK